MPSVRRSVIVGRTAPTMFALVDGVEDYPQFLPWCAAAEVYERTPELTRARLDIDYHGLTTSIGTRNVKRPPGAMALELEEGPFDRFSGEWRFVPLGDGGCRVELAVDYAFSNAAVSIALGPVFGSIVETLVDRFVERAESLPANDAPRA
jgi:ribosome-associated toxin RatA of RatAB toxin-antitoxin module